MEMNYLIKGIPFPVRVAAFVLSTATALALQFAVPTMEGWGFLLAFLPMLAMWARAWRNKPKDLGFEDWTPVTETEVNRVAENFRLTKAVRLPPMFKGGMGILIIVAAVVAAFVFLINDELGWVVVAANLAIILAPPFFFGKIALWVPAELKMKLDAVQQLFAAPLAGDILRTPYLRFDKDSQERRIPEDVRLMLEPKRKAEDFVGAQFQVAINNGPNGAVPYAYSVLIFRGAGRSFVALRGLRVPGFEVEATESAEYSTVVIRQDTGGGGYHTDKGDIARLLAATLDAIRLLP